ncbi:MAG TPA: cupredoxin family copper-binding protein [Candidatus Acidoferrales bacterium]|nr:cupredoxin family copper-binding protein [Candidatus Acidoferrales bacterium]
MKKTICRVGLVTAALLLSLGMKTAARHHASAGVLERSPQALTVELKDFSFQPATLAVATGTEVTWVNRDEEPHTVVSTTQLFASKALDSADRFSHTFSQPGTFRYFCSIHPKMVGTIIVKDPGSGFSAHRR